MPVLVKPITIYNDALPSALSWTHKLYVSVLAALTLAFLMVSAPKEAFGEKIHDLYKAEVPIEPQADRKQLLLVMGEALGIVLTKVTGEVRNLANADLKEAMKQPEEYVIGYSYRRSSTNPKQQILQVEFVKESVNRLLRQSGIAIWGISRPPTLLWLAVQNTQGRNILNGIATETTTNNLNKSFTAYSLPMIFPLLDVEDSNAISVDDVWRLLTNKITKASERYGEVPILAGRLLVNNYLYNGRLSLIFNGEQIDAEINNLNENQLSLVAADLVGSTLSKHYAVASLDAKENPRLLVKNIFTVADYNSLLHYLEKLTAIRSTFVRRISGSESIVELELVIDGYSSQLTDIIALGKRLRRINPPTEKVSYPSMGSVINYMWVPP